MINRKINKVCKAIHLLVCIFTLFLSIKYFCLSYLILFTSSTLFLIFSFKVENNKKLFAFFIIYCLLMINFSMIIDIFMPYRPIYTYKNYYNNSILDKRVFEDYTKEIEIVDFRVTPAAFQYSGGAAICIDCNNKFADDYLKRHQNSITNHGYEFPERLTRFYDESFFSDGAFNVYYIEKSVERECGFIISKDKLKICVFSV